MKQVYSYPEIRHLLIQGCPVSFTCHIHAEVTAIQAHPDSDAITATIHVLVGEYVIAVVECEYPSLVSLLDAFDMNESLEIWEVSKPKGDTWNDVESRTGEGIIKE